MASYPCFPTHTPSTLVVLGSLVLAETLVLRSNFLMYPGNVTLEEEGEKLGACKRKAIPA
ncbi:MAG: hypothetical protein HY680_07180 [Chloroflexi bacterium]|nr:hypothetical protein [Chloroflexota bacterium]